MSPSINTATRVSRCGLWFGGTLILIAAVLIGIDVVLRKFFDLSIGGADELAGYALAIGGTWAMPAALLNRGHIRIDSLYSHLSAPVRIWLDFLGLSLFVIFISLVAWHGFGVLQQSWDADSHSQSALQTPLIVPQALWVAGMVAFPVVGLLLLFQAGLAYARGDIAGAIRLIGTRSAEEDVEEELRAMQTRSEAEP